MVCVFLTVQFFLLEDSLGIRGFPSFLNLVPHFLFGPEERVATEGASVSI